jgi:hypothetical protein
MANGLQQSAAARSIKSQHKKGTMIYAQFWTVGAVSGKPIEACGSDAIIVLDGRYALRNLSAIVKAKWKDSPWLQSKFIGFTIHQGKSFVQERKVLDYQPLSNGDV